MEQNQTNQLTVEQNKENQQAKPAKVREVFIDFFRAVCIFLVLCGHRNLLPAGIGVFVLPGFFIASGYTFRANNGDFKTFFIKRVKRLLVPFWIALVVFGCLEILRGSLLGYGYGDASCLIPVGITAAYGSFVNFPIIGEFGQYLANMFTYKGSATIVLDLILPTDCHLWFLPALFSADMVLYGYFKFRKDKVWMDIVAMFLLIGLAGIETIPNITQLPYGLGRGFLAAAFMLIGYRMKTSKLFTSENLKWQLIILAIAIVPSIASVIHKYDGTGIVRSYYGQNGGISIMFLDVYITFICGVSFSYVVMYAMYWLAKIPNNPVSRFLAFAGRNSMDIYLWHMLIYFLADLFMIFVIKIEMTPDKFFMEVFNGNQWLYRWLIVPIAYVLLLVYAFVKGKIKTKIASKKTKIA